MDPIAATTLNRDVVESVGGHEIENGSRSHYTIGPNRKCRTSPLAGPALLWSTIGEVKGKELVRRLRRAGVEVTGRAGGTGHLLARDQGKKVPVPMHGDRDIGPDFVKMLCKELGVNFRRVL